MSRLRPLRHPGREGVVLRGWIRGSEVGIVALATLVGLAAGLLAVAMGTLARLMHVVLFGISTGELSQLRHLPAIWLLLVPALGGLVLGLVNLALARWRPKSPVDPIEANALHGGRLTLADGAVVATQTVLSNGFGASVGLEAGYTQVGAGIASRLGQFFRLRRSDLRTLVGCGAAAAIAAAFGAPLTGAFYGFELVIGTYSLLGLAPVIASAVVGSLVMRALHGDIWLVEPGNIAEPVGYGVYLLALPLGLLCGLAGIALMRGVAVTEALLGRLIPVPLWRVTAGGLVVGTLALVSPVALSAGHGALHLAFDTEMAARGVALLLAVKVAASAVSLGSGFRGGLFFASLLMGALLGKLFAAGLAFLAPPGPDPLLFAVVGMSAFGTAVIGAPLAMTFLALETTGSFPVAGLVLAAVVVAALVVRRLFGYSFATWRFHLRGETIRSAHDIGWVQDLTVERMMRRDVRTVRDDTPMQRFRHDFPLGSTQRVVAVDAAGRYAGIVSVPEAHATDVATVAPLLQLQKRALLATMNVRQAMSAFDAAEAEALVVLDSAGGGRVLGLLTEAHLLRRYGEELEKRRREEAGLT
ncbi:chloride channel protein [Roseomonas sp. NAR14]|uniref:Chloride channel protein n=1 Tax=Roseomonas acroporae TaxID=2937791 RepID=A0A9X1YBZ2_9PROT|nr:chloride channel protein [Roseomonas acroporae]MCK8783721.1 chloride channel protein [Roseomonas acroporae]